MSKFALFELEQVVGQIRFFQLSINGRFPFTDFCNEIEHDGNQRGHLIRIWRIFQEMADGFQFETNIVKPLKGGLKNEFEIKRGPLRVYFIKDPEGHIIILGGQKKNQSKDISKFRAINKEYLKSKL